MNAVIVWFRNDLRLADNPALRAAVKERCRVIPVFIHNPIKSDAWRPGAASKWWLHHSLHALDTRLREKGSRLIVRSGASLPALASLAEETGAKAVYWNRRYEPQSLNEDRRVEMELSKQGLRVETLPGSLLSEPWEARTANGGAYRVFSPFWKRLQANLSITAPVPEPTLLGSPGELETLSVDQLGLRPKIPWDSKLASAWVPGETSAMQALATFCEHRLTRYADCRDRLADGGTSRLSAALHFGEISSRQAWHAAALAREAHLSSVAGCESFQRQLAWRDFAWHLLLHFPNLPDEPMAGRFRHFPWASDYEDALHSWQNGNTGIPIVDAGMRQLWQIGWMHNRARMLTASLLCKNLLIPWRHGEEWFWDTLVDADLANNAMGWQWVAGSGADATPYFRIFNPVRQGERFDPEGAYVRRWVPELAGLPGEWIHHPWESPTRVLSQAGVRLGSNYPEPIVDLATSRRAALAAFAATGKG